MSTDPKDAEDAEDPKAAKTPKAAKAAKTPKAAKPPKAAKGAKTPKSSKKAKGSKKGAKGGSEASARTSVASHPRAAGQVRRAKGFGGIAGFAIAAYLSHKAHVPPADVGIRALAAGISGYMLAWACSVAVWRHLVLAEMRALVESGRMVVGESPATAAAAEPAAGEAKAAPKAGG
ncbi:MAG: hypothetical protein ACLP50_26290 [Solirubrobacteraceae bacterium]